MSHDPNKPFQVLYDSDNHVYKIVLTASFNGQKMIGSVAVTEAKHELLAEMVAARLNEALDNAIAEVQNEWKVTHQ
jgi:hypothetical protein